MSLKETSKFLALILRHKPEVISISLDEHGWADVELEKKSPPAFLYHGTGKKYVESIEKQGLIPKSRLYVHLSAEPQTAVKVGSRHGSPVVYQIDTDRMAADGYDFYLSANGVWLTKTVPPEYLEKFS